MKISLIDYLSRKRTSYKDFILINKISSYDDVLFYCKRRDCEILSQELFDTLMKPLILQEEISDIIINNESLQKTNADVSSRRKRKRKNSTLS